MNFKVFTIEQLSHYNILKIKKIRKERNLTQEQLGDMIGVKNPRYQNLNEVQEI
ncbi:MAG: helix-turn-helix domain-containing protein [Bacteroidales bacterium]